MRWAAFPSLGGIPQKYGRFLLSPSSIRLDLLAVNNQEAETFLLLYSKVKLSSETNPEDDLSPLKAGPWTIVIKMSLHLDCLPENYF